LQENNQQLEMPLFEALKILRVGEAKSKVIVLLTDGKHNFGKKISKRGELMRLKREELRYIQLELEQIMIRNS